MSSCAKTKLFAIAHSTISDYTVIMTMFIYYCLWFS